MPPDYSRSPSESASPSPLTGGSQSDSRPYASSSTDGTLKRRASPSFEDVQEESSRKRLKDDYQDMPVGGSNGAGEAATNIDGGELVNELEQELQCACCSALVYRPVIVAPCQHFFCGRCASMPLTATRAHM